MDSGDQELTRSRNQEKGEVKRTQLGGETQQHQDSTLACQDPEGKGVHLGASRGMGTTICKGPGIKMASDLGERSG